VKKRLRKKRDRTKFFQAPVKRKSAREKGRWEREKLGKDEEQIKRIKEGSREKVMDGFNRLPTLLHEWLK